MRVVGDLNADGYADLAVGAPDQSAGANGEGNLFLYYGTATGVPTTPTVTLDSPANQAFARFGASIGGGGDIDADGFADLVTGAQYEDGAAPSSGRVYVFRGGATGLAMSPGYVIDDPGSLADPTTAGAEFGCTVAMVPDVNGDGFADLLVGAIGEATGTAYEGSVFVYHGGLTGPSSTPNTWIQDPADQPGAYAGWSVAGLGDVDGDGFGDIAVGAVFHTAGAAQEGATFVFSGSSSGLPTRPTVFIDSPVNQVGSRFGGDVAGIGDINGDGFTDLLVGAANLTDTPATESREGHAYAYFGGITGIPATPNVSLDNPANQANARFGMSVGGACYYSLP